MKYGYVRVSTTEQKIGRQLETMIKHGVDIGGLNPLTADDNIINCIRSGNTFIDKMSGKNTDRPQFQDLLNTVQSGDTIVFSELSRMGRNLKDIINISDELVDNGVNLVFEKENIDPSTTMGRAMMAMFGVIAQVERELILERTREGVNLAKAQGKYKGKSALKTDKDNLDMVMSRVLSGELHYKKACELITYKTASGDIKAGVCLSTFYKLLDKWAIDNGYEKLNKNNIRYIKSTNENNIKHNDKKEYTDEDVPSDIFSDMNID